MTDSDTTPRRGRRARELSPEESAALESRTAAVVTGEMSPVPGARGAVAAPEADAAIPKLRKFGRRARIIELSDPTDEQSDPTDQQTAGADSAEPSPEASPAAAGVDTPGSESADGIDRADDRESVAGTQESAEGTQESAEGAQESAGDSATATPADDSTDAAAQAAASSTEPGGASTAAPAGPRPAARRTATLDRDRDGVELGELPVSEAPDPRPAPRFDGKVLHRPERSGGRPLLWVVWALIAIAGIALVALLLSGVLGTDTAALAGVLDPAFTDPSALFDIRPPLEEAAA